MADNLTLQEQFDNMRTRLARLRAILAQPGGAGSAPKVAARHQIGVTRDNLRTFLELHPEFGPLSPAEKDMRAALTQFLDDWQLPHSLVKFISDELKLNKSQAEILADLRETDPYKAKFGNVNAARIKNGLGAMSESEILNYRGEARRLAASYLGVDPQQVTQDEVDHYLASGKSLSEMETDFQVYNQVERWGPTVKHALEQELGYTIGDDRLFAFMHPEISTPELDEAYKRALERAQPEKVGLGLRPEEEVDILRKLGIDPQQAFAGYQGVAAELPRFNRLALIESNLNQQVPANVSNALGSTPFGTLFNATFLQDPVANAKLQNMLATELARFQAGGGPAASGTQAVGLLSRQERAQG